MRYETAQAELGLVPGADGQDYRQLVLDALVERELIGQAAAAADISISPNMVDDKFEELGQTPTFEQWLANNHWTPDEFKKALAAEMLAEAMIAEITTDVPYAVEQVRASYIQVDDAATAEAIVSQINEGVDFGDLAVRYSRDSLTGPAGGDLGFFARGSLLVPELEEAAYQLETEEVSGVISVTDPADGKVTHYIIKVTERDPERPLNARLRSQLMQEQYEAWLDDARSRATITYLLDAG